MLLKAARVWYLKLTLMVLRVAIDVCQLQMSVQRWHILPRPIVSEQPPCHAAIKSHHNARSCICVFPHSTYLVS